MAEAIDDMGFDVKLISVNGELSFFLKMFFVIHLCFNLISRLATVELNSCQRKIQTLLYSNSKFTIFVSESKLSLTDLITLLSCLISEATEKTICSTIVILQK